ncbi:MAG: site-2 protease family protein [Chloroflexi bacterium]|nr:site-2 protease family protein [Chloroflexota bacterium]
MRIDGRTVLFFVLLGLGLSILLNLVRGNALQPAFNVTGLVILALSFLVAIDVHEFGHAFIADRLGDPTARWQGRVSLNPLVHLDPFGTLMIILSAVGGIGLGWGRPVPVDPRRLRYGRWGMALVSVAGVLFNIITAALLSVALHLPFWAYASVALRPLFQLFLTMAQVNIILAAFNFCVPLPPLDGYNFLVSVLPLQVSWRLRQIEQYGPLILLLLIIASQMGILLINPLQYLVGVPASWLTHGLRLG